MWFKVQYARVVKEAVGKPPIIGWRTTTLREEYEQTPYAPAQYQQFGITMGFAFGTRDTERAIIGRNLGVWFDIGPVVDGESPKWGGAKRFWLEKPRSFDPNSLSPYAKIEIYAREDRDAS